MFQGAYNRERKSASKQAMKVLIKNVISDDWETWERISQKLMFWRLVWRHGI